MSHQQIFERAGQISEVSLAQCVDFGFQDRHRIQIAFFDIAINDAAKNWYVNVGNPGRSYCIDIGLVLADGRFVLFARSNFVTTPIDGPSLITDEEWMIVEDDFNKLYGLSAGLGIV